MRPQKDTISPACGAEPRARAEFLQRNSSEQVCSDSSFQHAESGLLDVKTLAPRRARFQSAKKCSSPLHLWTNEASFISIRNTCIGAPA